jgi:Protein of unknown function (DUF2809)
MPPSLRARAWFAVLALSTVALGLLIQRAKAGLPQVLGDVLGDALWAVMLAWWVGAIAPSLPRLKRAVAAVAVCWVVEFSQLYHAPWIDSWRSTTLGHLVLGTDFDPRDLAAYSLGVLSAFVLEQTLFPGLAALGSGRHEAI